VLDIAAMREAASRTVGQHDFTAFTPKQTEHVFFHRTVLVCEWQQRGDELVFVVEANAFLRNMVRVLAGTMMQVGRGAMTVDRYAALLQGAPREAAGPTAPPHPLTLVAVRYPPD
jgi:tRNA pseudouridine38-40 synthase